jgi:hypothetical protein
VLMPSANRCTAKSALRRHVQGRDRREHAQKHLELETAKWLRLESRCGEATWWISWRERTGLALQVTHLQLFSQTERSKSIGLLKI